MGWGAPSNNTLKHTVYRFQTVTHAHTQTYAHTNIHAHKHTKHTHTYKCAYGFGNVIQLNTDRKYGVLNLY